jgi:hypothetical protein
VLWGIVASLILSPLPLPMLVAIVGGSWVAMRGWMTWMIHRSVRIPSGMTPPLGAEEPVPDGVRRAWAEAGWPLSADGFAAAGRYRREVPPDGTLVWSELFHRAGDGRWATVAVPTDRDGAMLPQGAARSMLTRMDDGRLLDLSDDATPAVSLPFTHWLWSATVPALRAWPSLTAAHDRQVERYRAEHPGTAPDTGVARVEDHVADGRRQARARMLASGRWRDAPDGDDLMLTWRGAAEGVVLVSVPWVRAADVPARVRAHRAARALGVDAPAPSWPRAALGLAGAAAGAAGSLLALWAAPVVVTWAAVGMVMARFHASGGRLIPASAAGLAAGGALGIAGWFAAALVNVALDMAGYSFFLLPLPLLHTVPVGAAFVAFVLLARAGLRAFDRAFG